MLSLHYDDDSATEHGEIALDIERQSRSVGTILAKSQRVAAQLVDGDTIPARFASLMALEAAAGSALVEYSNQTLTLSNAAIDTDGAFENHHLFGNAWPIC